MDDRPTPTSYYARPRRTRPHSSTATTCRTGRQSLLGKWRTTRPLPSPGSGLLRVIHSRAHGTEVAFGNQHQTSPRGAGSVTRCCCGRSARGLRVAGTRCTCAGDQEDGGSPNHLSRPRISAGGHRPAQRLRGVPAVRATAHGEGCARKRCRNPRLNRRTCGSATATFRDDPFARSECRWVPAARRPGQQDQGRKYFECAP
jgi:hypothetical protein